MKSVTKITLLIFTVAAACAEEVLENQDADTPEETDGKVEGKSFVGGGHYQHFSSRGSGGYIAPQEQFYQSYPPNSYCPCYVDPYYCRQQTYYPRSLRNYDNLNGQNGYSGRQPNVGPQSFNNVG